MLIFISKDPRLSFAERINHIIALQSFGQASCGRFRRNYREEESDTPYRECCSKHMHTVQTFRMLAAQTLLTAASRGICRMSIQWLIAKLMQIAY